MPIRRPLARYSPPSSSWGRPPRRSAWRGEGHGGPCHSAAHRRRNHRHRRHRWRRSLHREPVIHGGRRSRGCRRKVVRQSCGLIQVRHCRLLRSARPAHGFDSGTSERSRQRMRHRIRFRTHLPPRHAFVGPIRAALGVPCVFNVLGPLTNPANPKHMAVGCANRKMSSRSCRRICGERPDRHGLTSHEGLDEMAPTGPVSIWEFKDGKVTENKFDPTVELGLAKVTIADLKGGEPTLNAQLARDFFAGKDVSFRTTALLNAASAIVADGHLVPGDASLADRFKAAYAIAEQTVDSGKATALLDKWIATAQAAKKA